MLLPL